MSSLLSLEALRALPTDCVAVEDPCVYFLWAEDELLYIGGTTQSCDRLARHIRDRNYRNCQRGLLIPFKQYTFLEVPTRVEMWKLELEYIRHYDPPYNEIAPLRRKY